MRENIQAVTVVAVVFIAGMSLAVDQRLYAIADGSAAVSGADSGSISMLHVEDRAILGNSARRALLKFDTTHFSSHEMRGATLNLFGGRDSRFGVPTMNIYHYADDSWTESRIPYASSLGNLLLSAQVPTVRASYPYQYAQISFGIGYNLPANDDNDLLSIALVVSGGGNVSFNSRNTVSWDGSAGNEPFIDFRSWGMTSLANSSFDGVFDDWVVENGNGLVEVIENPRQAGDNVARLTTGSPVSLSQTLDTPQDEFYVLFDYEFLTDTGSLELTLTDRDGTTSTIGTLDAPAALSGAMSSAAIHVTDPSLLYLDNVTFGMEFDGMTGSQILLDNIEFSAIPEPSSVVMLLLGAGGMTVYRRLKVSGKDRLNPGHEFRERF